jgi:uncharacterized protein YueI
MEGGQKSKGTRKRKFIGTFNVRIMSMLVVKKTLLEYTVGMKI